MSVRFLYQKTIAPQGGRVIIVLRYLINKSYLNAILLAFSSSTKNE